MKVLYPQPQEFEVDCCRNCPYLREDPTNGHAKYCGHPSFDSDPWAAFIIERENMMDGIWPNLCPLRPGYKK
jgi:hypothetical protein